MIGGRPDDHGNDRCRSLSILLHGLLRFDLTAVVGIDEVRADKQQNDLGVSQIVSDLISELCSREKYAIVPISYDAGAAERGEMLIKIKAMYGIGPRVAEENANCVLVFCLGA